MDDLIKRQDAIDAIYKESKYAKSEVADEYADMFVYAINTLPSAEPVIRCKDCEHDGYCCRLLSRTPNDYCSHAKRRTDERFN